MPIYSLEVFKKVGDGLTLVPSYRLTDLKSHGENKLMHYQGRWIPEGDLVDELIMLNKPNIIKAQDELGYYMTLMLTIDHEGEGRTEHLQVPESQLRKIFHPPPKVEITRLRTFAEYLLTVFPGWYDIESKAKKNKILDTARYDYYNNPSLWHVSLMKFQPKEGTIGEIRAIIKSLFQGGRVYIQYEDFLGAPDENDRAVLGSKMPTSYWKNGAWVPDTKIIFPSWRIITKDEELVYGKISLA